MDNILVSCIAGVTSFIALLISIYSVLIEKKRLSVETITKNRIEWIGTVREIVICFLECYQAKSKGKMVLQASKLALYTRRNNPDYDGMLSAVGICVSDTEFISEHADNLIKETQDVLASVWNRMKWEAGISTRSEAIYVRKHFDEISLRNKTPGENKTV